MKKSREFLINDEEMYQYFERLIYGEDSRLLKKWRVNQDRLDHGLTGRSASKLIGAKKLLYSEADAGRQICLLETLEKFLHEYIGIRGLEELLINNYGVTAKMQKLITHSLKQEENAYFKMNLHQETNTPDKYCLPHIFAAVIQKMTSQGLAIQPNQSFD